MIKLIWRTVKKESWTGEKFKNRSKAPSTKYKELVDSLLKQNKIIIKIEKKVYSLKVI
jgi:hypothetical protein